MSAPLKRHLWEIQRNLDAWEGKPLLRRIYAAFYERIVTQLDSRLPGRIVEIGSEERVKIGDPVTFFDAQPGSRPEDVSESCGASVYDLTMHLNPLLPRRLV